MLPEMPKSLDQFRQQETIVMMKYQAINAQMTDAWCEAGWEWGQAITHEEYVKALKKLEKEAKGKK